MTDTPLPAMLVLVGRDSNVVRRSLVVVRSWHCAGGCKHLCARMRFGMQVDVERRTLVRRPIDFPSSVDDRRIIVAVGRRLSQYAAAAGASDGCGYVVMDRTVRD